MIWGSALRPTARVRAEENRYCASCCCCREFVIYLLWFDLRLHSTTAALATTDATRLGAPNCFGRHEKSATLSLITSSDRQIDASHNNLHPQNHLYSFICGRKRFNLRRSDVRARNDSINDLFFAHRNSFKCQNVKMSRSDGFGAAG